MLTLFIANGHQVIPHNVCSQSNDSNALEDCNSPPQFDYALQQNGQYQYELLVIGYFQLPFPGISFVSDLHGFSHL
jgi:hypothetical protein